MLIGIDIGGTKISVALTTLDGEVLAQHAFPTEPLRGFPNAIEKLIAAIEQLMHPCGGSALELSGIGIGCTGPVDPIRGTIHNPHTLPTWDGCDPLTPLRARFGVSVRMENDADTAALGEYRFGAGRNSEPTVMLTFGTGIGFAAIVRGQIYRGVDGSHPELGHIATAVPGPRCYCGIDGCFESLASGSAIEAAGREAGFASSRAVFAAAKRGDRAAASIVDRALQATASATWTIAHSFLPERMILGGGIMEDHFALFANAIEASLARAVMIPRSKVQVVPASLGSRAGVIGAACLVMRPS